MGQAHGDLIPEDDWSAPDLGVVVTVTSALQRALVLATSIEDLGHSSSPYGDRAAQAPQLCSRVTLPASDY